MKINSIFFVVFLVFSCKNIEPRRPIDPKPSTTIFEEAIEESKKINKIEEEAIANFIKADTTNIYIQSPKGFWYTYVNQVNDSLPTPQKGDEVTIQYNIARLNDSIVYSYEDLGLKKYVIDKEDFISGLQKGLKLMKTGETITFVIPSYNAFGVTGDGNEIGINETLKSTVTLIEINKKKNESN